MRAAVRVAVRVAKAAEMAEVGRRPLPVRAILFDLMDTLVHDPIRDAIPGFFGMRPSQFFAAVDHRTRVRPRTTPRTHRRTLTSRLAGS